MQIPPRFRTAPAEVLGALGRLGGPEADNPIQIPQRQTSKDDIRYRVQPFRDLLVLALEEISGAREKDRPECRSKRTPEHEGGNGNAVHAGRDRNQGADRRDQPAEEKSERLMTRKKALA
jgi:hypothetical protein